MTYAIEGRHCELLRVELADGERVIADVGTLVYLRGAVEWHVVFPGRGRRPPLVPAPAWAVSEPCSRGRFPVVVGPWPEPSHNSLYGILDPDPPVACILDDRLLT